MGGNYKSHSVPTVGAWKRKEMIRTGLLFTLKGNTSLLNPQNVDLVRRHISGKGLILLALRNNGLIIKRKHAEMPRLRARLRASWRLGWRLGVREVIKR